MTANQSSASRSCARFEDGRRERELRALITGTGGVVRTPLRQASADGAVCSWLLCTSWALGGLHADMREYKVRGELAGSVPSQLGMHALSEARYWSTIVSGRNEMIMSW